MVLDYLTNLIFGDTDEQRSKREVTDISNPDHFLASVGPTASSGVKLTEATMLGQASVMQAVRLLSQSVAMSDIVFNDVLSGGITIPNTSLRLHDIFNEQPNTEQSPFTFRQMMMGSAVFRGNAVAEIERDSNGREEALWPLPVKQIQMVREKKTQDLFYVFTPNSGGIKAIPAVNIFHLRGFHLDGLVGMNIPFVTKDAIGNAIAMEQYSGKFFSSGASPGGVLEHPSELSDPARKNLKDTWEEAHRGLDQAHRIAVLEEGIQWKQTGIDARDAQLIEGRVFSVHEIARALGVPLSLLMEDFQQPAKTPLQEATRFLSYSLGPWFANWTSQIKTDFMNLQERKKTEVLFDTSKLLSTDPDALARALRSNVTVGIMKPDEARSRLNIGLNPLGGLEGESTFMQLNMAMVKQIVERTIDGLVNQEDEGLDNKLDIDEIAANVLDSE